MRAIPTGVDLPDHVRSPFGIPHVEPMVPPSVSTPGEPFPLVITCRAPEATFTPTAASLRTGEGHGAGPALDLQTMVSEAISRIFAAGIQQAPPSTAVNPPVPVPISTVSELPSAQECMHSEGSLRDEDYFDELDLSDEGTAPDMPGFPGLF